jgi:hypothetical protein
VSVAVVVANLIVDLLYAVVDPTIRRAWQGEATVVSRAAAQELRAQPAPAAESATP